jgi:hypothetical protein
MEKPTQSIPSAPPVTYCDTLEILRSRSCDLGEYGTGDQAQQGRYPESSPDSQTPPPEKTHHTYRHGDYTVISE